MPFAWIYRELLADCAAHGEAGQDDAVIIEAIRRRIVPPDEGGEREV